MKSSRNKSTKNDKIKEIFDLLSINGDSDSQSLENNNDYENSSTKAPKRNKSNKKRKKYYP